MTTDAVKVEDTIRCRFSEFGFPFVVDRSVIPKDDSTLFVCSGMQQVKERFRRPDKGKYGSRQSCIRMNDIGLVGDGQHLTYFEMVGNFSFGNDDYEQSVELWHLILNDLGIPNVEIRVHPTRIDLADMWRRRGYKIIHEDEECIWTDGDISGECCEVFCGDLELGNLVNPLGHSVDVGFGLERLYQVVEGKSRVDQTSLFVPHYPVVQDHSRALKSFYENGISPGNKGRGYVCRKLVRRMLPFLHGNEMFAFDEWITEERGRREKAIELGKKKWEKFRDKSAEWWFDTYGVLPEELHMLW